MFNTIKSKILIISISLSLVLLVILTSIMFFYYQDIRDILINRTIQFTEVQSQKIDFEILRTEKNARDLALMGELYYKFDKNPVIATKTMIEVFDNYPLSLGGGIWFKPYLIDRNKKLSCIYVYRNNQDKLVIDKAFETEEYNYLNQGWYKDIMPNLTKDDNVEWSFPYYEKEGSNSLMITAGTAIYDDNRDIVGLSTVDWKISTVLDGISMLERELPHNSFVLFANPEKDYIIATTDPNLSDKNLVGKSLKNIPYKKIPIKNLLYNNSPKEYPLKKIFIIKNKMLQSGATNI